MSNELEHQRSRFWAKVGRTEDITECWIWQGRIRPDNGYPEFHAPKLAKTRVASRWSFYFTHGRWPAEGMEIDHACGVPACVNPSHLDEVTHRENMHRTWRAPIGSQVERIYCKRGHPLFGENLYVYPQSGYRACRTCGKQDDARFYERVGMNAAEYAKWRRARVKAGLPTKGVFPRAPYPKDARRIEAS